MKVTHPTATLNQRSNGELRQDRAICTVARLANDLGFVRFDGYAAATQFRFAGDMTLGHRLADAMAHKPYAFERNAEGPT